MGWNLANAVGMTPVGMPAMPSINGTIGSLFNNYSTGVPRLPAYGSKPAGGYAPIPPVNIPVTKYEPLASTGVGAGLLHATPAYKNAGPNENQYYWGKQPFIETMADMGKLNDPKIVGTKGWSPAPQKPFDLDGFLRDLNKTVAANAPKYPGLPGYTAPKTITRK